MAKLTISPDQQGYAIQDGKEVLASQHPGGAGRYRRDIIGATSRGTFTWTVGNSDYEALKAFFLQHEADTFQIDLLYDTGELVERTVNLVVGSVALRNVSGTQYVLAAELEIWPS